jgi:uncharacterized alkaline shock family protein YloU
MGVSNRILLFVFSLSMAALAVCGVSLGLPWFFPTQEVKEVVEWIHGDLLLQIAIIVVSFLVFIISLNFLWVSIKPTRKVDPGIDRESEIGIVRISLLAIEEIATTAGKAVKGVHALTARVHLDDTAESLQIGLKMAVDGKEPIQQLSESLQQKVREQVESIAGVSVSQVSIYVSQTMANEKKRVRVS